MTNPSDTTTATGIRHRKPRAGERTRGAVDAMQTKIAVGIQNLDPACRDEQLQAIVDDLPDAIGTMTHHAKPAGPDGFIPFLFTQKHRIYLSFNLFIYFSPQRRKERRGKLFFSLPLIRPTGRRTGRTANKKTQALRAQHRFDQQN